MTPCKKRVITLEIILLSQGCSQLRLNYVARSNYRKTGTLVLLFTQEATFLLTCNLFPNVFTDIQAMIVRLNWRYMFLHSRHCMFDVCVCCVLLFWVLCAFLCVCFGTGHFVTVPLNLTYLHCLQHSLNISSIYFKLDQKVNLFICNLSEER